jgi:sec-independent protein translocase protein TatC
VFGRTAIASDQGEMPFLDHVRELRSRLIGSLLALAVAFIVAVTLYDHYIGLLIEPFGAQLYATQIEQAFTTKIRMSLYAAIIFSFPVHLYNVVAFVLPALTAKERRILSWLLGGSFLLLMVGTYLAYCKILPLSIEFLKSAAFKPEGVDFLLDYRKSLAFISQMMIAFLALFQLPLVLLILMALDVVKRQTLLRFSRYIIVLIFVLAALLTPPDIVSQLGLAVPLILLFYVTILIAKICGFGNPDEE